MKYVVLAIAVVIAFACLVECCDMHINTDPSKLSSNIRSILPSEKLTPDDVPSTFDWRNVDGRSWVTVSRNQHSPTYCASCWAFSTTAVLGDRMRIMYTDEWPEVDLAPQVLLSCGGEVVGNCTGGDAVAAFQFMQKTGITDETCAVYQALDNLGCTGEQVCKSCGYDLSNPNALCYAVENPPTYFVDEYGYFANSTTMVDDMKAEIYARGPIVCGVATPPDFVSYTGGIFNDTTGDVEVDHYISVVGWGVDNDVEYWIVRNSWGTFWGEQGWAKVVLGTNNIGIESFCAWATPMQPSYY